MFVLSPRVGGSWLEQTWKLIYLLSSKTSLPQLPSLSVGSFPSLYKHTLVSPNLNIF